MKNRSNILLSLLLTSGLLVGCATQETSSSTTNVGEEEVRTPIDVSFATSGQGGTFYVAGAGISALTTRDIEGLTVTAEVTQGVTENARLMANNESEMGFAYGSTAYNISRGLAEFAGEQYKGLRAVANIHDGALNFVTLQRNSSITKLDDLVGKKVSIGPRGSGSASVATEFLQSVGLFDRITIQYLSFTDSANSLKDNQIDAFVIGGTSPIPALIELEATNPLRFLEVEPAKVTQFIEQFPYHVSYTIPTGVYTSVTKATVTVGYSVIWVAREDVPTWVIYEMLKTMFSPSGRTYLENVQRAFSELSSGIDRFKRIELPLHPGAEKYYKEAGLLN
jgi:TRAP transporter TAXI family solute receptor